MGWVDFDLVVPLSAQFCLDRWKTGRIDRTGHATLWNTQIKVNLTNVSDGMNNPVLYMSDND